MSVMKTNSSSKNEGVYDSKVIEVRRTALVRRGGRNFSFSALAVVGDGNGKVGFSYGKAEEVAVAVRKAIEKARKNMVKIILRKATVQHPIYANFKATKVIILPGVEGTGIIAGGAMRSIFEVLGIKNVIGKSLGSRNPGNVVQATIKGLSNMASLSFIAKKRGISIEQVLGKNV